MTSAQLHEAIHAGPFRPFNLHMGGGRSLNVPHREFISISPRGASPPSTTPTTPQRSWTCS
jgi:hypothetical protein